MIIYHADGSTAFVLESYNEGSKLVRHLMSDDYIVLPFTVSEPVDIRVGDYLDARIDLYGETYRIGRYMVIEEQTGEYNQNTGCYDYNLRMEASYMSWKHKKVKYRPESGGNEISFTLTSTIGTHLTIITDNLRSRGFKYNSNGVGDGVDYAVAFGNVDLKVAKLVAYDNLSILDALTSICKAFDVEWWISDNFIHVGKCEVENEPDVMELGENVSQMSRNTNGETPPTRIYAFGSARNLPSNYRANDDPELTISAVVQRRLALPTVDELTEANRALLVEHSLVLDNGSVQYMDVTEDNVVESVVVNDDIYPRTQCKVAEEPATYTDSVQEEDGTTTVRTYYRLKDSSGFQFSTSMILPGMTLHILFTSGAMNGMDFECKYSETEKYYEVVANENYGRFLPDTNLHPSKDDTFVIYNWDSSKMADTGLIQAASNELLTNVIEYIVKGKTDPCEYSITEDAVEDKYQFRELGDRVKLVNPAYFAEGKTARIIGMEVCLDIPYDHPKYTVSENSFYVYQGHVEGNAEELTFNGQSYSASSTGGGGGMSVYIIKHGDLTQPTDDNVFSARRSIEEFLSKKHDDTAEGLIKFLLGLKIGKDGRYGIDKNGNAVLDAVTSSNFLSGGFGGAGFGAYLDENGVSTAEVDKLIVRMKAVFNELEIKKRTYSGGNIIFSSAGNKVLEVLPMDSDGEVQRDENGELVYDGAAAYRCLWLMQDGEDAVENTWSVDDQARCETFNIKEGVYENVSNRYYWRKVLAMGDSYEYSKDGHSDIYNYIDLAAEINGTYQGNAYTKGMQDVEPVDIPKAGDNIVQVGNQNPNKRSRQNLIEIIVNDTNAPAIMYYEGVNDYSFDGKLIRGDYYDPMTHRFKTVTYGDSYVGDKAQTTYVKYTQDGGAEFKGKVHIEAGSTMSDEFINQIAGDINVSVDMPDITEEVDKALDTLDTGNENLLRNSAFIGEWVDEEPTAVEIMKDTDEMWSRHIKYWTVENVKIEPCSYVASATAATLGDENEGGTLKQTVEAEIEEGATYCFSLRGVSLGGNNTITMTFAGVERTIEFDSVMTRQVVKFVALIPELNTFTLTGKGTVAELMLNKGAVPNTDWIPSPQDNPRALSKYKELAYMRTSIFEASTDILGGLVLTQMLKVGNYRDNVMIEETGGMSGLMTSPHSPYLWGGGTLEQAFDTIAKYAQNPRYQPTQEELSQMAQFVVTHGGRAILNEAIVRGTVYATNGVFKGRVEASEGEFHGKIYADEGEFGGLVYTPWKVYNETGAGKWEPSTKSFTFNKDSLNIIFDGVDNPDPEEIEFYVTLPTTKEFANKTIKIFSPTYVDDSDDSTPVGIKNGVSVSMPTMKINPLNEYIRWQEYIYGFSCGEDRNKYKAKTITFDGGILSLASFLVRDMESIEGYSCSWYVESFTYRRAVITGDDGVKWGNGRGNFGGKRT